MPCPIRLRTKFLPPLSNLPSPLSFANLENPTHPHTKKNKPPKNKTHIKLSR